MEKHKRAITAKGSEKDRPTQKANGAMDCVSAIEKLLKGGSPENIRAAMEEKLGLTMPRTTGAAIAD
jgi:hypothetical protein